MSQSRWRSGTLGDEIDGLEAGVSVNAEDRPHRAGELGVLKTSALTGGIFRPSENKAVWPKERLRVRVSPEADSILVSRMNTPALVGESAYVDRNYPTLFLPDRIWMLRFRQRDACCVRWLAHLFQSHAAKTYVSLNATGTSGSMKNLPKARVFAMPVEWPPYSEQRGIADLLDTLDELIRQSDLIIAKLRQMQEGLQHDLVTRGIDENGELRSPHLRPSKFKSSPLGPIPNNWEIAALGTTGQVITGSTPPSRVAGVWGAGLPFVTPGEISAAGQISSGGRFVSVKGKKFVTELRPGSLLVVCIGSTVGKMAISSEPCATNQQINAIVPFRGFDVRFLQAALAVGIRRLLVLVGLQAVPIVNRTQFESIKVPTADAHEQERIGLVLAAHEERLRQQELELKQLRLMRRGLMEDLITGRIRVKTSQAGSS